MLFPANMPSDLKWLPRARLWRAILLHRKDGSWDMTQGLSTVVFAHEGANDEAGVLGSPLDFSVEAMRESVPSWLREHCAEAKAAGRGKVDPERFWATLLTVNAMEILEFCWLENEEEGLTIVDKANHWLRRSADIIWGPKGADGKRCFNPVPPPRANRKSSVVASVTDAEPASPPAGLLQRILGGIVTHLMEEDEIEDDENENGDQYDVLHAKASLKVEFWSKRWLKRVKSLRNMERKSIVGASSSVQRIAGELVLTFLTKHEVRRTAVED
jgi:hypothetical protein